MIKKLTIIGFLIFAGWMAWLIPQVIVAIQMTSEAMDNDPSLNLERPPVQIEEESDKVSETPESSDDSPALRVLETIENARITAYTKHDEGVNCISASPALYP